MNIQKNKTTNILPLSASDFRINLLCVVLFFAAMYFLRSSFPKMGTLPLTLSCLFITVVPLWFYDLICLRVHKRLTTGLLDKPGQVDRQRLVIKLIGLCGTFLAVLVLYRFNPAYYQSVRALEFYSPFFNALNLAAPLIMGISFIYFWQMDRMQKDPCDGYWHVGCLFTGRLKQVNTVILKEHARVWFIKGFFIPFMFALLVLYTDELLLPSWENGSVSFLAVFNYLLAAFYAIDVLYGVLGYILTVRILDTHIQSTEPTLLGWLVCLACYSPFSFMFGIGLFPYEDDYRWQHWFALDHFMYCWYGIMIIVLTLIYALSTVAIGYRMSNLTYRGIITSGPYRFTKHPAYLSKVASWWLISLPFYSVEGSFVAIMNTFNLFIISLIYYLRARTEENHLSNYPEYVAYAQWINQHGIFSFITKRFPALQYSEEKCKKWKSVVWFKQLGQK